MKEFIERHIEMFVNLIDIKQFIKRPKLKAYFIFKKFNIFPPST